MKQIFLLSLVFILSFSCKSDKKEGSNLSTETTVYYLIRHAEKDRSINSDDPELTDLGIERANNWAAHFKSIELDYIYSTDYKRTQQTALPTAIDKKLVIQSYDPKNLNDEIFKGKTKGKKVLIVGHSNTTPAFVNAILGKQEYQQIDDDDNGKLFIVTIQNEEVSVEIKDYY